MDLTEVRQRMKKTLDFLRDELAQIKTGRATPALIEKIVVEAYETKMPLVELATITSPEPSELLVAPFDQSIIKNIERAIALRRELGLSPMVDQTVIRIKIASLTEERRIELTRVLSQRLESGRVAVRQIRHEERSKLKKLFEDKEVNEDERHSYEEELQELTEEINGEIENLGEIKRREIMGDR